MSSESVSQILESEVSKEVTEITDATTIEPIVLSYYATKLSNALEKCPLSLLVLCEALYENGFQRGFDSSVHSDTAFIEVTTRHL